MTQFAWPHASRGALTRRPRDKVGSNGHARQTDVSQRHRRGCLRRERHRIGADLSQSTDQDRGRFRAGRSGRRDGASDRTTPDVDPRAEHRHRQSAGRRGHHRGSRRRGVGSRRLHAAPRQHQHARHQPVDLQERELRSRQRLRTGRCAWDHLQSADRQSRAAGEIGARADRARAGEPGQAQLRVGRHRDAAAPDRRDVQAASEPRRRARSL